MRYLMLILSCFLFTSTHAQKIALNFAGDDDWVTGTNNSLPQGNNPRTIEAWIKYSTSRNDMSIFNYGTFSFNQKFTLHLYNGVYIIGEGNDLNTGFHFNDGNWHHLAVTHNGATTIVYVDGVVRGSRNTTYNTTGFNFQMGVSLRNSSWDFRFEGTIDELRVWNVARTQQEIIDNMNLGINTAPGLIASYHLNDGLPNADNQAITTVQDESGTGSHGTLNNFALIGSGSNFVDDAMVTLPLDLLSFTATEENCNGFLKWHTAVESNMWYFMVEESNNGITFTEAKKITPLNSDGEHIYTTSLPLHSDKTFYRLKMVDNANKVMYSKTVFVKAANCGLKISFWPNPARNLLYLRTEAKGSEYSIYTATGVLVKKGQITQDLQQIDISKLSSGLYYLAVGSGKPVAFRKE